MCSTGLNACNLGYRVSVHKSAIVVMANMASTRKIVQVVRWSSRKRRVVQAYWSRPEKWFFPDPVSPKSPPKWGKGNFFLHCHKKCQFCFTQEIKDNLNFAPKVFQTTKTNWYKQKSCSKKVTFLHDSTVISCAWGKHRGIQLEGETLPNSVLFMACFLHTCIKQGWQYTKTVTCSFFTHKFIFPG